MTATARLRVLAAGLILATGICSKVSAFAQISAQIPVERNPVASPVSATGWIGRLRRAAQQQSYSGTLVVTTDTGLMAGSRVVHACHDGRQIERVDVLDGPARTVFRRDGEMRTFLHAARTVEDGLATSATLFPKTQTAQSAPLDALYRAVRKGTERVAGHDADVVWLVPLDSLRFGYRIWSEQASGVVLRVQTVQEDGRVLEQTSFLQIDLTSPVPFESLSKAMDDIAGYVLQPAAGAQNDVKPNALLLRAPIPGYILQGCRTAGARANTVQCNYADGLASVSVFVQPLVPDTSPPAAASWAAGATHAIAQSLDANTWLTVMGEVPIATLVMFAQRIER